MARAGHRLEGKPVNGSFEKPAGVCNWSVVNTVPGNVIFLEGGLKHPSTPIKTAAMKNLTMNMTAGNLAPQGNEQPQVRTPLRVHNKLQIEKKKRKITRRFQ